MTLEGSVIRTSDELEAHAAEWEEIVAASEAPLPMSSPTWLATWWRIFGKQAGRELSVFTCRERGRLVGMVPLVRRSYWYGGALPFRRLEWMGTGEGEADEICCEYLAPITRSGFEDAAVESFGAALADGLLGSWDELVLPAMDGSSAWPKRLEQHLGASGVRVATTSTNVATRVALPASFDRFLASLSSSSRYLVRRAMRDLDTYAGGNVELRRASTPRELEIGRSVLLSLHDERWQGQGAFRSARFHAFHERVMPELFARGELELVWMMARDEPIAAAYNFVHRGTVHFYQGGRRTDLPKHLRPGIAMHAHAIRRAIDLGHHHYDWMAGGARYKRQLGTETRPIVTLRAVRPSLRETVREFARGTRHAARSLTAGSRNTPGEPPAPTAVLCGDLNMLRCFTGSGVETLIVASDPESAVFASRHARATRTMSDPKKSPSEAARDLATIGKELEERAALYYGDDAMLQVVSQNRDELARHYRFLMPTRERIDDLVDKVRFARLAEGLGLPIPPTLVVDDATTARTIESRVGLPCVLKPSGHVGWARSGAVKDLGPPPKLLTATSRPELDLMLERIRRFTRSFVAQPWIEGGEDRIVSFHVYVRADGTPLSHYVGRKIRTYPRRAGISTFLELVRDPEAEALGLSIVKKLGHVGIAKLDFKVDAVTGRYALLEVNPRFNLWHHLGAASGVNLPLIAHADLLGLPLPPSGPLRTGIRWISFDDDLRSFLRDYGPSGELSVGAWLDSLRGEKVYDVFAWDDPSPLVALMRRELVERFARDDA